MYQSELKQMILAEQKASQEIMNIYRRGFHTMIKSDDSPVTDADLASNKIIRETLSCFSNIAWLSEEDSDNPDRLSKQALFVIDPLDGTQDFVNHDDSFGINIALVVNRTPVVSVVGVPAQNSFAYAIKGEGSFYVQDGVEKRLHVSDRTTNLRVLSSLSHELDSEKEVISRHQDIISQVIRLGASTKAICLASGQADASVRFTPYTKEWDVCAPELIVTEAGGIFLDTKLKPFVYNRKDVYNHDGYCMFNRIENTILLK